MRAARPAPKPRSRRWGAGTYRTRISPRPPATTKPPSAKSCSHRLSKGDTLIYREKGTGCLGARAVLFDYGGTLDGEGWHWFDRTLHLYRRAGCDLADDEIKRAFYRAEDAIGDEARRARYQLRPLLARH